MTRTSTRQLTKNIATWWMVVAFSAATTASGCASNPDPDTKINGEALSPVTDDSGLQVIKSAISTSGDMCGAPCGDASLDPGQACCRKGGDAPYDTASQCCTTHGVQTKFPMQDLNACPNYVARDPVAKPSFDGCSIELKTILKLALVAPPLLLEAPLWASRFDAACNQHDLCYGDCTERSKPNCDTTFMKNMGNICDLTYKHDPAVRAHCHVMRAAFHAAVKYEGSEYWEKAKKSACNCCAGDASCLLEPTDLALSTLAVPALVKPGNQVDLAFQVTNLGPVVAVDVKSTLQLTADLSQVTSMVVDVPGLGSIPCTVVARTGGGSQGTCTVPSLNSGGTATIQVSALTSVPGQETAIVDVSAAQTDPNSSNNSVDATWQVDCSPPTPVWNTVSLQCEECPAGETWSVATNHCDCSGGKTRNPTTQRCEALVGEYTVYYRYNAGGCGAGGNPYSCVSVSPGPLHVAAVPGTYRVDVIQVNRADIGGGGMVVWSGDSTSGTEYFPAGQGVEFVHGSGEITLYYNDWYAGDNDPSAWTIARLYGL